MVNDTTQIDLSNIPLKSGYRTGDSDPINEFYSPCLAHSTIYKRAAGYFRSSIYLIIGSSIIDFAKKGGKIQLICSPYLDVKDIETIESAYEDRIKSESERINEDFDAMIADENRNYPSRILATLIAFKALDIKIAFRPEEQGLYHEKIGIFQDEKGNRVSFTGSSNESWSGWHSKGNFESIEVFCSWHHESERERTLRHEQNFDLLWAGEDKHAMTVNFPEASLNHIAKSSYASFEEAERNIEKLFNDHIEEEPKKKRTLMQHQSNAILSWIKNGRRGVLKHATGSGKTFTAIEASRPHISSGLPVLILVPSSLLLEQWEKELKDEFPDAAFMLAGSGNNRWKTPGKLKRFSAAITSGPRVIIATMQTAATDDFRKALSQGEHLMVIADEVHQIGSIFNSKALLIDSGSRLGLSATPERYGDPEGTEKIFNYFGAILDPIFSLSDAVSSGRLVQYEYFPHPIHLTAEEADKWKKFTKQISFELARSNFKESKTISEKARLLIIQRSRVAKKAHTKIRLARDVIQKNFHEGESWLIYCEDSEQLNLVKHELKDIGINAVEYHSKMDGDRAASLDWFKKFGGVLVSIKCLDEGIDIPGISHALILASSQNPRQFIQRRGRVLRTASKKSLAVIHDAIVVPLDIDLDQDQMSLLKSEIIRAIEFSDSAINKSSGAVLREIANKMGFDSVSLLVDGVEEEENE